MNDRGGAFMSGVLIGIALMGVALLVGDVMGWSTCG